MASNDLSSKAQESLGLVPGTKFWSPFPFAGLNLQDAPIAISDQEFIWVENYFHTGAGYLRTAWDHGLPFYTSPIGRTIVSFYFFTRGTSYYVAVFLSDGSGVEVHYPDGAVKQIAGPGTFYDPTNGQLPACRQWGVQYLLISNRNTTNDYWIWDGAIFYKSGTAAPAGVTLTSGGQDYTTLPTIQVYGGHGSGLTITPSIQAGQVVFLQITNPGSGYQVGDNPQVQFSGGGSDTGAILQANLNAGGVAAANITAEGSGYTTASISFSGGGGAGAAGTAIIGNGVASVTVTVGGSNYTGANITFSGGGGSGAAATAIVNGGQVVEIDVTSPGSGYTSVPTVNIAGDGTAAAASAVIQNGAIVGITITAPGSGYTSAPSINIAGDGSGASAVAVLTATSINGVTVVNPGSGFLYAPVINFIGGGGTGATGVVELVGTSIAKVNVLSPGAGYDFPNHTQILFSGGGPNGGNPTVAAQATPIIAGGQVVGVNLTNGGSGYVATPNVYVNVDDIGKGTNAPTAVATVQAIFAPTSIASVQMSNYGLHYTDAPAVQISAGANNSAYATISLMPFGVSGLTMETFGQRVWIADPAPPLYGNLPPQGDWQVTAPGSFTDFATSDGGLQFTNSDSFLQTEYTAIHQTNGYLYFFGDGSASVVSNVQTSGNPATTTLTYQNVDPQAGALWRDSQQDFSKTILVANNTGVYGLYGGALTLVSAKLQRLFDSALFPPIAGALTPTSATATIYNVKHYLLLMTMLDPEGNVTNKMIAWNEKDWTIESQSINLQSIGTQKVGSKLYAWGTDGNSLYPLFSIPSATLQKRLDTKYFGGDSPYICKDVDGVWAQAQDLSQGEVGITLDITLNASGLAIQNPQFPSVPNGSYSTNPAGFPVPGGFEFTAPPPYWPVVGGGTGGFKCMNVSVSLTSTSPDFVLGSLVLGYTNEVAFR